MCTDSSGTSTTLTCSSPCLRMCPWVRFILCVVQCSLPLRHRHACATWSRVTRAGTMNTIYIVRTMMECVNTFDSERSERVCDLDAITTLVLLLSMPAFATLARPSVQFVLCVHC
jgi:hypothetical protein